MHHGALRVGRLTATLQTGAPTHVTRSEVALGQQMISDLESLAAVRHAT